MPFVQQRRGTASELQTANELPLAGQIYYELDTNKLKVGDGSRRYNELPYLSESTTVADLDGLQGTLDANAAAAAAAQQTADTADVKADALTPIVLQNQIDVAAVTGTVTNLSTSFGSHASRHNVNTGHDPLYPADIGAATQADFSALTTRVSGVELDVITATGGAIANANDIVSLQTDLTSLSQTVSGLTPASIGAQPAGTYATLVGGTVPAAQLPSYVDDVVEGTLATFPNPGEAGKIYVDTAANKTYRWSGSQYIEIASSPGSTDVIAEGVNNLYFTYARVLGLRGTGANTICAGDDSRLSDSRQPLAHQHAQSDITNLTSDLADKASKTTANVFALANTFQGTVKSTASSGFITQHVGDVSNAIRSQGATASYPTAISVATLVYSNTGLSGPLSLYFDIDTIEEVIRLLGLVGLEVTSYNSQQVTDGRENYSSPAGDYHYRYFKSTGTWSGVYATTGNWIGNLIVASVSEARLAVDQATGSLEIAADKHGRTANTDLVLSVDGTEKFRLDGSLAKITGNAQITGTVTLDSGLDLSQLNSGGASSSDVLTWNGTAWVAATPPSGGSTGIGGLTDVAISSPATGQYLRYVSLTQNWVNSEITLGDVGASGASLGQVARFWNGSWGPSTLYLSTAQDVSSLTPTDGQVLTYDATAGLWRGEDISWGSITGIPSTFAPSSHTHPQSDVTNLTTDLAAKAALTGATFSGVVSSATGGNSFLANQFASTATNPQYSFVNYTTTGMYMPGGNLLGFTVDGTAVFTCRAGLSQLGLPDGVIVSGKAEVTGDIEASGTAKFASLSDGTTTRSIAEVMSPPWANITGKPATFAPSSHTHAISDLTQSSATSGQVITWDGTAWVAATPTSGGSTDLDGLTDVTISTPAVGEVLRHDGSEFVNAALGISDITNLQTELNGKASTSHNHSLASLSDTAIGVPSAQSFLKYSGSVWFATYVDIPAVSGLQAALDTKVESDTTQAGGGTAINNLVVITQTDYNNLATKDANTIYFIT